MTLLPLPLSPTMAMLSPSARSRSMPLTADMRFRAVAAEGDLQIADVQQRASSHGVSVAERSEIG